MFEKGRSGNPGGLSRQLRARIAAVRDAALVHAPKAIEKLAALLDSDDAKAVIGAAQSILDRAVGKPATGLPVDDKHAARVEAELKTRAELQAARTKELQLLAEVEELRRVVAELQQSRTSVQ